MADRRAFTLNEAIAVTGMVAAAILLLLLLFFIASGHRDTGISGRSMCGTRLRGIGMALHMYAASNRNFFPSVGKSNSAASAIGFGEVDRVRGTGARLDDNVTAPYWLLVRDGSVSPKNYVCSDAGMHEEDPLTHNGMTSGVAVELVKTNDFYSAKNLSYSMFNMHHGAQARHWTPTANADVPFMSDNNDNNAVDRHTFGRGATHTGIRRAETSSHHKYEGQNVLFGDGHASFEQSPFAGPGGDNIFAMIKGGKNAPPSLGNSDGDAATDPKVADTDAVLLPITGNGGGAGSLDPTD